MSNSQECSGKTDICCELLKQIEEIDRELAQRRLEMLKDRHELFKKHRTLDLRDPDHGSWEGHEIQMKEKRIALEKKKKDFHRNKCDPPDGGLPEATRWPIPVAPDPKEASAMEEALKTAGKVAFGVGAGAAVLIGISRIIRLLPPLWPLQLSPI